MACRAREGVFVPAPHRRGDGVPVGCCLFGSYAIDANGVEGTPRTQTGEQSEKSRTPKRKFGRSADVRCAWAVGLILRDLRKSLSQACVAVAVSAMKGTPGKKERNCPSLR